MDDYCFSAVQSVLARASLNMSPPVPPGGNAQLTFQLWRFSRSRHISLSPLGYISVRRAFIGEETASRAPANLEWTELRMPKRRLPKQTTSLKERLAKEATQLREQAQGTPPGFERELLVRKARRAERASHMIEWLASAPKHLDRFK
jgi:hypothetical protein